MVHNGIEYGVMAAYAEGLNILKAANSGTGEREADARKPRPFPVRNQYYRFDINLPAVTEVWRHGSVIGSWLLDLTAEALKQDRISTIMMAACLIPVKGAGHCRRLSTRAFLLRFSRLLFRAFLFSWRSTVCRKSPLSHAARLRRPFGKNQVTRRYTAMAQQRSDVLVVFGVTGDLAYKMIFPSLYAMVKRKTLSTPIIGVAFEDWTRDQLIARAKEAVEKTCRCGRSGGLCRTGGQAFLRFRRLSISVNIRRAARGACRSS